MSKRRKPQQRSRRWEPLTQRVVNNGGIYAEHRDTNGDVRVYAYQPTR